MILSRLNLGRSYESNSNRLHETMDNTDRKDARTMDSISKILRLDATGAKGFGTARWLRTEDSLQMLPDKRPVPTRVPAEIGISDG